MFVFTTRVWLAFLLDASHRVGLTPLSKRRLHRLIFLSNCLAPLFEAVPNSAHIVKYKHGPFYPKVQWEIDRLATIGVLTVFDVEYTHDKRGWWVDANYGVGELLPSVVIHCQKVAFGKKIQEYLSEVAAGFSSLRDDSLDQVALSDENYNQSGSSDDQFIDFSEHEKNFSVQTANAFRRMLPSDLVPTRKEELFLYMRFLEAVVIKKAV